jgi:hypothetical protein
VIKMSVSLKKVRLDSYQKNLRQLSQVVGKAAADVEGTANASILKGSGKYRQYADHWSSPPGSPPNSDTGNLANSIGHRMTGKTSAEVFVRNVSAKYAVPLELGWMSKAGNHVPARPFLRPAVAEVAPSFQAAC